MQLQKGSMNQPNSPSKGKKKTITLDEIAKGYTNPELFKDDCAKLSGMIKAHVLKYGYMGWWVVEKTVEKL